jgi:hypothetical protein
MCEDNIDVYRRLVRLETDSTFAFQESHWLGDVAPHILDPDSRDALACAKRGAQVRETAEAGIPKHLLYEKGIPHTIPTWEEARQLSEIRQEVAQAVRISVDFTKPERIIERYQELIRRGNGKSRNHKHGTGH